MRRVLDVRRCASSSRGPSPTTRSWKSPRGARAARRAGRRSRSPRTAARRATPGAERAHLAEDLGQVVDVEVAAGEVRLLERAVASATRGARCCPGSRRASSISTARRLRARNESFRPPESASTEPSCRISTRARELVDRRGRSRTASRARSRRRRVAPFSMRSVERAAARGVEAEALRLAIRRLARQPRRLELPRPWRAPRARPPRGRATPSPCAPARRRAAGGRRGSSQTVDLVRAGPSTCTGAVNSACATRSIRCASSVATPVDGVVDPEVGLDARDRRRCASTGRAGAVAAARGLDALVERHADGARRSGIAIGSDWTKAFAPTSS